MKTVQLEVPDMSCGHCVQVIEGAIAAVPGVERVEVSLDTQSAMAVVSPDVQPAALVVAVQDAGYSPSLASSEDRSP